jgi:hypothetical protein
VREVIVEDQLDRGVGRIGGVDKLEEFDEFAAAMAIPDQGMDLAVKQVDAAQGPLLPGTPRSRIQSQDGGGSVHLPRGEDHQGDRGGSEAKASDAVAIVSYDEKPGIQAIATTDPDLSPEPGLHATFTRDHEYKRNRTVSLLAGFTSCSLSILHTVPCTSLARQPCPSAVPPTVRPDARSRPPVRSLVQS